MDKDETVVDCDDLVAWMVQAEPRTRMDAYPLLVMCKDLLRRLAHRELRVSSRRAEELSAELAQAQATIDLQSAELNELRRQQVNTDRLIESSTVTNSYLRCNLIFCCRATRKGQEQFETRVMPLCQKKRDTHFTPFHGIFMAPNRGQYEEDRAFCCRSH